MTVANLSALKSVWVAKASDALLWTGLAALAWLALRYHFSLASFPYQLQPSEAGLLQSTRALQKGWDPWSVDLAPAYVNLYGIGYPWLCAQLSRLSPSTDLLLLMRSVTAASIFLVLGLAFRVLRGASLGVLPAAAACLAVYCTLLYFDLQTARADGLVLAMFYLSVAWALKPGWRHAAFSGAVAGAAFFVKSNGLIALGLACALLAFWGRRRDAFVCAVAGAICAALLALLILQHHPLYFLATLSVHLHHQAYHVPWLLLQWLHLLQIHWPWVLALGAALIVVWRQGRPLWPKGAWRQAAVMAALVLGVLLSGPGAHPGAYLSYYNQMLLPLLFIAGALWLAAQGLSARWLALLLLLDGASALRFAQRSFPVNTPEQTAAWAPVEEWVRRHPDSVFPPLFTSLAVRHQAFITDNEHSHYLEICTWGERTELKDAYSRHTRHVEERLMSGSFQSLVCGGNWSCPGGLEAYGYREVAPFILRTPLNTGSTRFSVYAKVPSQRRPAARKEPQ